MGLSRLHVLPSLGRETSSVSITLWPVGCVTCSGFVVLWVSGCTCTACKSVVVLFPVFSQLPLICTQSTAMYVYNYAKCSPSARSYITVDRPRANVPPLCCLATVWSSAGPFIPHSFKECIISLVHRKRAMLLLSAPQVCHWTPSVPTMYWCIGVV